MIKLHGTVKSYIIGFLLSIILTLISYNLVLHFINSSHQTLALGVLLALLFVSAGLQLFVQLIFFLHLGKEISPRWQLAFFIATFTAILVIIIGSVWIMYHLNYNMTPKQQTQYINDQSGL